MYYPIQIPYVLDRKFSQAVIYTEQPAPSCGGFVICFWEMLPREALCASVSNIIAADACVDLVVSFDERTVGFCGMSQTQFDFELNFPARFFGARMMPGAFFQLTGLSAATAMDNFLPIDAIFDDFDTAHFFALPFAKAKEYFENFITRKTQDQTPDMFTMLFSSLYKNPPADVGELCRALDFSPRKCQRLFAKHFGISPKLALSIVRFQKCLEILTAPTASPFDILSAVNYYDQPHFINNFKRNLGITPLELLRRCRD